MNNKIKLTLGPILFYWPQQKIFEFYQQALTSAADIIVLGESVCGKRHQMSTNAWLDLASSLATQCDKQIILSSLALIESNSDLNTVKKLCAQENILVEAGDLAAVELLSQQNLPFVCGSSINIYNQHTLNLLQRQGMQRWVMPVELNRRTLSNILEQADQPVETEVFAYGYLPLAYSARCFTARTLDISKDNCNYHCIDYPDGITLTSQENQTLFTLNGIQTLSGHCYNLIEELIVMENMGISSVRISPQSTGTFTVIEQFNKKRQCEIFHSDSNIISSNGYWFGEAGMNLIQDKAAL